MIYLISEGKLTRQSFSEFKDIQLGIFESAINAGIDLIQIREKCLTTRQILSLARETLEIRGKAKTKILINDRADIAIASGADGVQLRSDSLSARVIRDNSPPSFVIGVSTHNAFEVATAITAGADFAVLGPIFASPGKGVPIGTDIFRELRNKPPGFRVLALGGINETNYRDILKATDGFAAIRFLNNYTNLRKLKDENLFKHCRN